VPGHGAKVEAASQRHLEEQTRTVVGVNKLLLERELPLLPRAVEEE